MGLIHVISNCIIYKIIPVSQCYNIFTHAQVRFFFLKKGFLSFSSSLLNIFFVFHTFMGLS